MPYSNIASIPQALKTAGLSLAQANDWSKYYDEAKSQSGITSPAAIAWKIFKQKYYKIDNKWKIKKSYKGEKMNKVVNELKGYELVYRGSPSPVEMEDIEAEGKTYEKELIREGEWAHPQKPSVKLKITLKRMQQWVENFNKNLFKVPVPKRHSLDPEDNRGWLKKLFLKKDSRGTHVLYGHLDITNDKMQKLIDNGDIQDVSVSIGDYMDNQGKRHGEALQHVALTIIPHIDSQSGFSPINNEGYICFEEVGYISDMEEKIKSGEVFEETKQKTIAEEEAPEGSKEREKENMSQAIKNARLFPEPDNFIIVGTYEDRVIIQYFGGGAGIDGSPMSNRYFEIPYTKALDKSYIFGDKTELVKKYYFITRDINPMLEKEEKKNQEEVEEMKEFEAMKEENAKLETAKVELEKKIAELKPKVIELEAKVTELEESGKKKDEILQKIEDEKKVVFEQRIEDKVSKLVSDGHVLPADKEEVKSVLLEGGKAAEILEKTLLRQTAVDLDDKTKSQSSKPTTNEGMTEEKAKAEADRIVDGK